MLAGDAITLALVTVFGFASHGTIETAGTRILATYIPLLVSWFLISPYLGVYNPTKVCKLRQMWRPFWAMVLSGPFAGWLRGVWLNTPVLPIFVIILGGVSALSILLWRLIYFLIFCRQR